MTLSVEQYLRPEIVQQVKRLDLKARFIAEGFLAGLHTSANSSAIQASYLEELRRFIDDYRRQCQDVRADFVTLDNPMPFDKALLSFLAGRKGRF